MMRTSPTRIKDQMVKDEAGKVVEGGYAIHQPSDERMSIYDAAMRYQAEKVLLVVFAGKEYGTGSSRIGPPRAPTFSASGPLWPKASSAFTVRTWWHGRDGASVRGRHLLAVARIEGRRDRHPSRDRERPGSRQKLDRDLRTDGVRKAVVPLTCRIDTLDELEYFRTSESSNTCCATGGLTVNPTRGRDDDNFRATTEDRNGNHAPHHVALLPFFMVCYFIAYVDRVNAGFAALQINKDLGLTEAAFGPGGRCSISPTLFSRFPAILRCRRLAHASGSRAS